MASRNFSKDAHHLNRGPQGLVMLQAKAALGAAAESVSGAGIASIAFDATGEYTLTLQDGYVGSHAVMLSAQDDSNAEVTVTLSQDLASDKTLKFQVFEAGSAPAARVTKDTFVHVALFLDNSSLA
jgi:hypothetical protein